MSPALSCEVSYLGRENVDGPADASNLARLVQRLLQHNSRAADVGDRRYVLQCSERGLRFDSVCRKDEGFESDDSESLKSSDGKVVPGAKFNRDSDETSSANSSGSDLDDPPPSPSPTSSVGGEMYAMEDIVFCHADPSTPHIIVWVVRSKTMSNLDAVVFQCKAEEDARRLFQTYREGSSRHKMERYKNNRRKVAEWVDKGGVSASVTSSSVSTSPRWNLMERTDVDGVTHLEVTSPVPVKEVATAVAATANNVESKDRQRHPAYLLTPQRPQRGNFVHRNKTPTVASPKLVLIPVKNSPQRSTAYPKEPHVIRGEVVRVLVSPPQPNSQQALSWWCLELAEAKKNGLCSVNVWPPEAFLHDGTHRRSRSKSPVRHHGPHMQYHQPEAIRFLTPDVSKSSGLSRKLKGIGDAVKSRWGPPVPQGPPPKPVIKKTQKKDGVEQHKKVTFSAFATVQVVD